MSALEQAEERFRATVERLIPDYFTEEAEPPKPNWRRVIVNVTAIPAMTVAAALTAAEFGWLPRLRTTGFEGSLRGLFLAILVSRWAAGRYAALVAVGLSAAGIICLSGGPADTAQWLIWYVGLIFCLWGAAVISL